MAPLKKLSLVVNYPVYNVSVTCEEKTIDCIKYDLAAHKYIKESYISTQVINLNYAYVNSWLGFDLLPHKEEVKLPLNGFINVQTMPGYDDNPNNYLLAQNGKLPATDICHVDAAKACNQALYPIAYIDAYTGYEIVSITDDNREEIKTAFETSGFHYDFL